jgi:imidazolonepropionase-like amidohydrolase
MAVYAQALSPLEVLEVASTGGAFMAGLETQIGTLESGKFADLVVLNSDPLDDIRHVADIAYVMKGGVLYDDDTLDELWPERRPYGTPSWLYEPVYEASDQQYRLGH